MIALLPLWPDCSSYDWLTGSNIAKHIMELHSSVLLPWSNCMQWNPKLYWRSKTPGIQPLKTYFDPCNPILFCAGKCWESSDMVQTKSFLLPSLSFCWQLSQDWSQTNSLSHGQSHYMAKSMKCCFSTYSIGTSRLSWVSRITSCSLSLFKDSAMSPSPPWLIIDIRCPLILHRAW